MGAGAGARGYLCLTLALRIRVHDPFENANVHCDLSATERQAGHPSEARRLLERAVELYRAAGADAEADARVPRRS